MNHAAAAAVAAIPSKNAAAASAAAAAAAVVTWPYLFAYGDHTQFDSACVVWARYGYIIGMYR
jgi:hypothetical protein